MTARALLAALAVALTMAAPVRLGETHRVSWYAFSTGYTCMVASGSATVTTISGSTASAPPAGAQPMALCTQGGTAWVSVSSSTATTSWVMTTR